MTRQEMTRQPKRPGPLQTAAAALIVEALTMALIWAWMVII